MTSLAAAVAVPFALDGDSVTNNNAAIAVVSVVSVIGGYLLLFALWWFVFRPRRFGERDAAQQLPEAQQAAARAGHELALPGERGTVGWGATDAGTIGHDRALDGDATVLHPPDGAPALGALPVDREQPAEDDAGAGGRGNQPHLGAAGGLDARPRHGGPMQIERPVGSRFRRR